MESPHKDFFQSGVHALVDILFLNGRPRRAPALAGRPPQDWTILDVAVDSQACRPQRLWQVFDHGARRLPGVVPATAPGWNGPSPVRAHSWSGRKAPIGPLRYPSPPPSPSPSDPTPAFSQVRDTSRGMKPRAWYRRDSRADGPHRGGHNRT